MDAVTKELAGISAAIAGHCRKCFAFHYNEAIKLNVHQNDIKEVVELGRAVRSAGNRDVDEFAEKTIGQKLD